MLSSLISSLLPTRCQLTPDDDWLECPRYQKIEADSRGMGSYIIIKNCLDGLRNKKSLYGIYARAVSYISPTDVSCITSHWCTTWAVKAELDNKLFFGLILCNPLKHFCVCKGFNGCHMQCFYYDWLMIFYFTPFIQSCFRVSDLFYAMEYV